MMIHVAQTQSEGSLRLPLCACLRPSADRLNLPHQFDHHHHPLTRWIFPSRQAATVIRVNRPPGRLGSSLHLALTRTAAAADGLATVRWLGLAACPRLAWQAHSKQSSSALWARRSSWSCAKFSGGMSDIRCLKTIFKHNCNAHGTWCCITA